MATDRISRRLFATGSAAVAASVAVPNLVAAQLPKPTVAPAGAGGDSMLRSLLAMTPDLPGASPEVPRETRFSHLVPHLDLFGLASGADVVDPRLPMIFEFGAIPQEAAIMAVEPSRWESLFGFHPFAIEAMVEQGPLDDQILLVRGAFDQDAVHAAWEATGYVADAGPGGIWRLGLDDTVKGDLAFESGFFGFIGTAYDCVAFLDDATVAIASEFAYIEAAQEAAADPVRSLLGVPGVDALVASMPGDLVRAILLPGNALEEEIGVTAPGLSPEERDEALRALDAIEDEYGAMPTIAAAIIGTTPGGPYLEGSQDVLDTDQRATYVASIAPVDPDEVETCLEIATARFDALHSRSRLDRYRDLLTLESAIVDGEAAAMTFSQNGQERIDLVALYHAVDLEFLYHEG